MSTITTRLIGSGQFSDGYVIARPLNPWVIWEGDATRPITKRFKIVDKALYELDGTTPASIPPSYVPSGIAYSASVLPVLLYPEDNTYFVEVIQRGNKVLQGYWSIPYDPEDDGYEWYDIALHGEDQTFPTPRAALDPVKVYVSSGAMWADFYNVIEGTIVYTSTEGLYWGRTSTEFVPFWALSEELVLNLIRDYFPTEDPTDQYWPERIADADGILGSVITPDTNDPTWNVPARKLIFSSDDYVHVLSVPFLLPMVPSGTLLRDYDPVYGIGGAYLEDHEGIADATLGSTTGSDTADPAWNATEASLTFGADDYATVASLPWV